MRDEHPQRSQDWKEEEKVEGEASGNVRLASLGQVLLEKWQLVLSKIIGVTQTLCLLGQVVEE